MKKITSSIFIALLFIGPTQAQCWKEISYGGYTSMGITEDGKLFGWGRNNSGQVGDNTTVSKEAPVQIGTDEDWLTGDSSIDNTFAIKTDGTLWAWGENEDGQHGDGTTEMHLIPIQVGTATDWAQVSAGREHVLAIKTNGTLWAWGSNSFGKLGDGTNVDRLTPVQVGSDTNWLEVHGGSSHTVGIKTDGSIWGWGSSSGNGTGVAQSSPAQIGDSSDWEKIHTYYKHSAAINSAGELWIWGDNNSGELGNATTQQENLPIQVGSDTDWNHVGVGFQVTHAIKENGSLWVWGDNTYGRLGLGSAVDEELLPVQLGTETDWKFTTLGYYSTLSIKNDNQMWSWGWDGHGQLGNGDEGATNVPAAIACPTTILSIPENNMTHGIEFFPNPVKDNLTIEAEGLDIHSVSINNLQGQEVINIRPLATSISLENLPNGLYIVLVKTAQGVRSSKMVKQQ